MKNIINKLKPFFTFFYKDLKVFFIILILYVVGNIAFSFIQTLMNWALNIYVFCWVLSLVYYWKHFITRWKINFKAMGIYTREDMMNAYSNGFGQGQIMERIDLEDDVVVENVANEMKVFLKGYCIYLYEQNDAENL